MSELKAFDIVVSEEGYGEGFVKYRRAVYDKPEADKVIADLKADYKEACGRLQTANLIKDEQLAATRHQKYKRCLNKAEWCEERCARYDLLQEHSGFSWRREIDFYFRWHCRWLELAEEYK